MTPEFIPFPKMFRLMRDIVVTEKIDGTNACVHIDEVGNVRAGSRSRWITLEDDNSGFAKWVDAHESELLTLGPGTHFGEWWGQGIQRGYGLKEKRLSLFNTYRWCLHGSEPKQYPTENPLVFKSQKVLPECVGIVPILYEGPFNYDRIHDSLDDLRDNGSRASPMFMDPEGIVVFHTAANMCLKVTLKNDGIPKSKMKKETNHVDA